jgi:hypothetical protein
MESYPRWLELACLNEDRETISNNTIAILTSNNQVSVGNEINQNNMKNHEYVFINEILIRNVIDRRES